MEIEVKIPSVAESITEAILSKWIKNTGDFVDTDEIICEVETDKTTMELRAEKPGMLTCKVDEGETCVVADTVIAVIDTSKQGKKTTTTKSEWKSESEEENETESKDIHHASPAAAKIMAESGLTPEDVQGTGKDGRITKADVQKAIENKNEKVPEKSPEESDIPKVALKVERAIRKEKMTPLRKTIAKRLLAAKHETAMLTTFNEVDMTSVMEARKQYKEIFKDKHGVGLGFMSFFTKAAALALKEYPAVNASVEDDSIVYHDYVDMGVAVSTPKGLVVPVIRNTEKLSFSDIESEIIRLAKKARDGKISIEDITGGTFTVTNGGIFGSMLSTPLINYPQAGILGMHNIVERPVGVNGEIVLRPIMYVALSYDHRLIDGRESVGFLKTIKEYIENPIRMMLEV